ncbi:MAG: hypothetical protein ISQ14_01565 [Verrucomicrobiae bacterium]|jgi:hypothetical protein|nr:hypothetical protein [Verrucomicrobiae bacterium]
MKGLLSLILLLIALPVGAATPLPPHPLTDPGTYRSPLEFFRKLLVMDVPARDAELRKLSPGSRAALQGKIAEYAALSPGERELRLRATELRYFLRPLLGIGSELRGRAVAVMPEEFRALVAARLDQWDRLDAATRKAILDNEWMLLGVLRIGPQFAATAVSAESARGDATALQERLRAWQGLSVAKQAELLERFNRFFSLNAREKEQVFERLPEYQRIKVFATIEEIRELPEGERLACMDALRRFVDMNAIERATLIRNAELWRGLSGTERQAWRMVVQKFPPMPPGIEMPPLPPGFHAPPAPINLLTSR